MTDRLSSEPTWECGESDPILIWDGFGLDRVHSGIGQYARHLSSHLGPLGLQPYVTSMTPARDDGLHWQLVAPRPKKFWTVAARSILVRAAATYMHAKRVAQQHPDRTVILHGLANLNLPAYRVHRPPNLRTVLTVHDVIPLLCPTEVSRRLHWQFRHGIRRVVSNADVVVCVSDWTRDEVRRRSGHDCCRTIRTGRLNSRINEPITNGPKDQSQDRDQVHLISVSRFETYKRFERLYSIVRGDEGLRLTLVTDVRGITHARETASDLLASRRLQTRTSLSDQDLATALSDADVYIQTSLYEGFCLPALDSLAAGRPVVYRSGSGIDEVCGNQVAHAMPRSAPDHDWSAAIAEMVRRSRQPGFGRACRRQIDRLGTWSDTAAAYRSIYAELDSVGSTTHRADVAAA